MCLHVSPGRTVFHMPTVFYKDGNPVFHKTETCIQLIKKPSRGAAHEVLSTDLADLFGVRPCLACYPDAPRVKIHRKHCPTCNKVRIEACPHNGGVHVIIQFKTKRKVVNKPFYVWPDQLYKYERGRVHVR